MTIFNGCNPTMHEMHVNTRREIAWDVDIWYARGMSSPAGLRERKKQRTRETIARVALDLFEQRGYDATTLADIAEAADVSPRTIFAYYSGKDDILLSHVDDTLDGLRRALEERPAGVSTLEALRRFGDEQVGDWPAFKHRTMCVVGEHEALRGHHRARMAGIEAVVAAAFAKDLGAPPGDPRPAIMAASTVASMQLLHGPSSQPPATGPGAAFLLDQIFTCLEAGLEALRDAPGPPSSASAGNDTPPAES